MQDRKIGRKDDLTPSPPLQVVLDIPKLPIVQNTKTSIPLCSSPYNISLLSVEVSNVLVGGLELDASNPTPTSGRISGEVDGVGLSLSAKLDFQPPLSGILCPLGVLNGLDGECDSVGWGGTGWGMIDGIVGKRVEDGMTCFYSNVPI